MHMRKARLARRADFTELGARFKRIARLHKHRALSQMAILRLKAAAMVNDHAIAAFAPLHRSPFRIRLHQPVRRPVARRLDAPGRAGQHRDARGQIAHPEIRPVMARITLMPAAVILSPFASGSARLTATAQASLQSMAKAVGRQKSVRVEAHTDSQGADAANLALSQQRADAVRQVLLAAGLSSARVKAAGKGESDPLTSNGTVEGRARNRRVEMIVE